MKKNNVNEILLKSDLRNYENKIREYFIIKLFQKF